jgi:hypothetical protein
VSDGLTEQNPDHDGASVRRRPVLRQRRQEGGRPYKHTARLSADEQAIVGARAGEAGVSVACFLAEAALVGDARMASERRAAAAELLAVRRLLAAIGGTLDQLADTAHATDRCPPALEATLEETMHATARILARVDEVTAAYGHLGLPHGLRGEHAAGDPHDRDASELPIDDVDVEGAW